MQEPVLRDERAKRTQALKRSRTGRRTRFPSASRQVPVAIAAGVLIVSIAASFFIGDQLWAEAEGGGSWPPVQCGPTEFIGRTVLDYRPPEGLTGAPTTPEAALDDYLGDSFPFLTPSDFSKVSDSTDSVVFALTEDTQKKIVVEVGEFADGWRVFASSGCEGFIASLRVGQLGGTGS